MKQKAASAQARIAEDGGDEIVRLSAEQERLLEKLQRRFNNEQLGSIEVSDQLENSILDYGRRSSVSMTKDLAFAFLKLCNPDYQRHDLELPQTSAAPIPPTHFRGQSIRGHQNPTSLPEKEQSAPGEDKRSSR